MPAAGSTLNDQIRRMKWDALDRYADGLGPADLAAVEQTAARINKATDAQMARWGIHSPALRQQVRDLFATPWTEVA